MNGDFVLGQLFQDREHHVLLSQHTRILDLQIFGISQKIGWGFILKLLEVHRESGFLLRERNRKLFMRMRPGLSVRKRRLDLDRSWD